MDNKLLMTLGAALLLAPAASATLHLPSLEGSAQAGLGPCEDQLVAEAHDAGNIDEHRTALVNYVSCLTVAGPVGLTL